MIKNKKILVVGAGGFIGGHLTNRLLRKALTNNANFSIIEIQERYLPHTLINRSLLRSIA